jgi:tRNA dimethylallyltransferase
MEQRLVVIAGPTASGKTGLAVELAQALGGEVISADSVQVYRRLDIGSAKPSAAEQGGIRHHLLDVADLDEPFDAARYVALADDAIAAVRARGRVPLVAGGTGLYLRALVRGLAPGIPSDPTVRAQLNARAAQGPAVLAQMHAELTRLDPAYAAKIHPTDPIRIVRALEVYTLSGEPLSAHHARHAAEAPRYETLFLGLEVERAVLRERIARRAHEMLARGWIEEVQALLAEGYDPGLKPLRSVGYAEVVRHLSEGVPRAQTEQDVVHATTAFAKRQRTWFRGEREVTWVTPEELRTPAWRDRLARFVQGA